MQVIGMSPDTQCVMYAVGLIVLIKPGGTNVQAYIAGLPTRIERCIM